MSGRPDAVTVFAPAKINLTLHVTGRRVDGYHELESLVTFADVGDDISITPSDGFSFRAEGPFSTGLPPPDQDLAVRAARLVAAACGRELDIALRLTKNLPLMSGIGGGSADAAAVAVGLCRLWHFDVSTLAPAVASLGADIPACLAGVPQWMAGIGERLSPAPALPAAWLVLVNPQVACPTPAVYAALKERFSAPPARSDGFADFEALIRFLQQGGNDLAAPAREIAPVIGAVLDRLAAAEGCALARLSGSGATVFGIFATALAARAAALKIGNDHPEWWVRAAKVLKN